MKEVEARLERASAKIAKRSRIARSTLGARRCISGCAAQFLNFHRPTPTNASRMAEEDEEEVEERSHARQERRRRCREHHAARTSPMPNERERRYQADEIAPIHARPRRFS